MSKKLFLNPPACGGRLYNISPKALLDFSNIPL